MPMLRVLTSVPKSKIPVDFADRIINVLSTTVRKPTDSVTVIVSPDCIVSCGQDSNTPAVYAALESIGHLGPEENKVIAKKVTAFISKELGVDPFRIILTFYDLTKPNVARKGLTVEDLEK